jgi:hypothetical protein
MPASLGGIYNREVVAVAAFPLIFPMPASLGGIYNREEEPDIQEPGREEPGMKQPWQAAEAEPGEARTRADIKRKNAAMRVIY